MNILYINHYAGSISMGMEFRPYYLAKEWMKLGHKVRIIAADYSHLRKKNPVVKKNFEIQVIDGVEYQWIKTKEYAGNGVSRAITMEQFCQALMLNAGRIAKDFNPDVVIASSTYPLDSYPAKRIAKKAGAKLVHEVHDMWPATLYEIGGMSKTNPFVVVMQIAENHAYRNCNTMVSLLPNAKPYMVAHGLKSHNFNCLQNGIDAKEWEDKVPLNKEHKDAIRTLKDGGKFIAGYFGGHALSNNLKFMLDVADAMKDDEVEFVLVGDGVEKNNLMEYAKEHNIENVTFLPPVPKNEIPSLLAEFDLSYFTVKDSPLYRFGVCLNKMFDSMMGGLPIVAALNADNTLIHNAKCGDVVSPDNVEASVDAIRKYMRMDASMRHEIGDRGRNFILENNTYESIARKFIEAIEK